MTRDKLIASLHEQKANPRLLSFELDGRAALSAEDRAAIDALLSEWAKGADPRAIEALGEAEGETSLTLLDELSKTGSSWNRAAALRALVRRRGETTDLERLRTAASQQGAVERTLSVYELKKSGNRAAIPLLLDALADPNPPVRVHAQEGLVEMLGLEELNEPRQAPLRRMQLRGMGTLPTLWPQAERELRTVFEAILTGASPESLDLRYRPSSDPSLVDALWKALVNRAAPLPVELFSRLGDHDRGWLEAVLLTRLTTRDPRSPGALAELKTDRLKEHLEAARLLAERDEADFVEACDRVLASFRDN